MPYVRTLGGMRPQCMLILWHTYVTRYEVMCFRCGGVTDGFLLQNICKKCQWKNFAYLVNGYCWSYQAIWLFSRAAKIND